MSKFITVALLVLIFLLVVASLLYSGWIFLALWFAANSAIFYYCVAGLCLSCITASIYSKSR